MSDLLNQWHGCYDEGWKGIIVDEAFSHPAKISYALIARIYEHAFKMGWVKPGDTVVDPFGGICGTALHAATHGLRWIGCELEPKFHSLGNQNIDLWQRRWGHCPEWVRPTLHCGDSRRLAEVIGMAELCISSPPYSSSDQNYESGWKRVDRANGVHDRHSAQEEASYGSSAGQLGSMREGDFAAVVSSPPFMGANCDPGKNRCEYFGDVGGVGGIGDYDAKVPVEKRGFLMGKEGYSEWSGQCNLGSITTSEKTFWSEARKIVVQCHAILRPRGHAIWVCKDFVRKGKRVAFSDQWLALCESIGFRLVCRHKAMLVKTGGTQKLLDGGQQITTRERKSFFRRLAEKKGSPRIDWEDVICVMKVQP